MYDKNFYGMNGFVWFTGIVENRLDPLMSDRVQVRFYGYHTADLTKVKTSDLQWAYVGAPTTSASVSGIGESPSGLVEGSMVYGFFIDGSDCQQPLILGTIKGIPLSAPKKQIGFNDLRKDFTNVPVPPDSTSFAGYPYLLDEPDVNRIARNESIEKTIIGARKNTLDKTQSAQHTSAGGSDSAVASVELDQPTSAYNAVYPYNHVRATESGHIQEFDDTPGAERLSLQHRAGTYTEIQPDGAVVRVVKANEYIHIEKDAVEHVSGKKDIVVDGKATIKVNDLVMEVDGGDYRISINSGSANLTIGGDLNINVAGNVNRTVSGNVNDVVSGSYALSAGSIALNSTVTVSGDVIAGGISLDNHTHIGNLGNPTSPPS